ncbi:MAG TPA: hypothetical protein VGP21_01275 [Opitutaceae bacterium]|jgi:hypothetical protein|nr:hypothetical protein [Opitutaceae bacterium]
MGRSLQVGFVFFAIFVAGMFTGGFLTLRRAKHIQEQAQKNAQQQQAAVPPIVPFVMRQMLGELDLTRDQRKESNRILFEGAETLRVLHRETDFALDRLQDDVDKILTPDQREKLGILKDAQRAKLQAQREAVQNFLKQRRDNEAAPASPATPAASGNGSPSPAAATPAQPAPAH